MVPPGSMRATWRSHIPEKVATPRSTETVRLMRLVVETPQAGAPLLRVPMLPVLHAARSHGRAIAAARDMARKVSRSHADSLQNAPPTGLDRGVSIVAVGSLARQRDVL